MSLDAESLNKLVKETVIAVLNDHKKREQKLEIEQKREREQPKNQKQVIDDVIKDLLVNLQKIVDLKNNYTSSTPKDSIVDQLNPLITSIKDILNKANAPTDTISTAAKETSQSVTKGGDVNVKNCFNNLINAIWRSFFSVIETINNNNNNTEPDRRNKTNIITDIYPSIINPSNPQLRTNINISSVYGSPIQSSIQDVDEMLAILKSISNSNPENIKTNPAFDTKNQKRHKITIEDGEIVNRNRK
jgi:hypothetical protein